ncbi:MAG: outer membrane beta-barrel family protein [Cellulophaga sp.]
MRYLLSFFVFLFFAPFILHSQIYEVSGTVKDGENTTVPYANVFILQLADSTIIKGSSANEQGFFVIKNVLPDTYFLRASYIGKMSKFVPIDVKKDVNIGTIIIADNIESLDEVEIIVKKPTVSRKVDRLVFHVENTAISDGNTWEVLKKTPGVIVLQDELQIRNQSATIYINDRKVLLSPIEVRDLLEGFSGVNIKSIEVISNPPARYDAEGGPILNIITTKNLIPGYKGSINGAFTQAIFSKHRFGTSHYFKTKKLNVFASYGIRKKKDLYKDDSHVNFINNSNSVFSRWKTDYEKTTKLLGHNANVILDYTIDNRNTIKFTSNLAYTPDKKYRNTSNVDMRDAQMQLDSTLASAGNIDGNKTNLAFDLAYKHKLKKKGASISINGHYTSFNMDEEQKISSDYFNSTGDFMRNFSFHTNAIQDISIVTSQLDYVTPIAQATMESGVKYAGIESNSKIDFYNLIGGNRVLNSALSDNFTYDETVFAAYASMVRNWDKWSLKLGLRGEYTDAKGISNVLGITNSQNYFELFPTFYMLHTPSEEHSFSLSYSRKLERPRYQDLNPFKTFRNENDFIVGNANLKPNFSHNFNFNYTLKGEYFFDLYYRDNGNYISVINFQDNQNRTIRDLSQNVLESISYGLDFTYSKSITNAWFLYMYTSVFLESETFLAVESNNVKATNAIKGFYGYLANYITLSKDGSFTGELAITYLSGNIHGSYTEDSTMALSLGLRKTLWNKKAVISLAVEDFLGMANGRYTSKYLNQDNAHLAVPESQYARVGFTYKFGNFKLSDNDRGIEKKERDRID